jgi:hypothetical protein
MHNGSQHGTPFAGKKMGRIRGTSVAARPQDEVAAAADPKSEVFEQALCRSARVREGARVEWKGPVTELRASQGK